jgi:hypothetical protein
MSNPAVQSRVSLVGDSSINEGSSGNYRLQLDRAATTDMTFTVRVNDGSAKNYAGDGSKQKYKGDLKKSEFPELNRDFTGYDSQGRIVNGNTVTLTIKAGQTTSDSYS